MTETTDIAALRNKFVTKLPTADDAKEKFIELLNGPHASSWFLSPYVVALLDAFEAERQRADEYRDCIRVLADQLSVNALPKEIIEAVAALKAKLANPVVLSDCSFEAVSHMAHWYSEGECVAWVSGAEHVKKQIVAAGFSVREE